MTSGASCGFISARSSDEFDLVDQVELVAGRYGHFDLFLELLGIKDVVSKSIGSQNPYNMIRATLNGLQKESSPRQVAQRRGKKVADILPKREDAPADSSHVAEEA